MEIEKFMSEILEITLNIPAVEVAELITKSDDGKLTVKSEAKEKILSTYRENVKKEREKSQEFFDNGYKKAQKESLEKLEKEFKNLTGFDSDLKGIELFKTWQESVLSSKPNPLSEDEIKKHPEYLKLEKSTKKQIQEEIEKVKNEYENKFKQAERDKVKSIVKNDILEKTLSKKPILPQSETAKKNQLNLFLKLFDDYDFQSSDDGKYVVLKPDGTRVEDTNLRAVDYDSFIESKAREFFDFAVSDDKQSTGNKNDGQSSNSNTIVIPKDEKEYQSKVQAETDPIKKRALIEAFMKQKIS